MAQQLALYRGSAARRPAAPLARTASPASPIRPRQARPLCAGCRAKEARYGFRHDEESAPMDRPRTLCFDCFRMELSYRQAVAARLARGWNGTQTALPLAEKLAAADRRRRRAQIAARHELGV